MRSEVLVAATAPLLCDDINDCKSTAVAVKYDPSFIHLDLFRNLTQPDVQSLSACSRSLGCHCAISTRQYAGITNSGCAAKWECREWRSAQVCFVHVLSSVHVCVLVARREHKGYVLELKPCRNDGILGCFGTSCRDTFVMQTVLSIIKGLFAETTFQILRHAMHAREISATRCSRDMHKKGQSKYHPSEAVGHSCEGTQK